MYCQVQCITVISHKVKYSLTIDYLQLSHNRSYLQQGVTSNAVPVTYDTAFYSFYKIQLLHAAPCRLHMYIRELTSLSAMLFPDAYYELDFFYRKAFVAL